MKPESPSWGVLSAPKTSELSYSLSTFFFFRTFVLKDIQLNVQPPHCLPYGALSCTFMYIAPPEESQVLGTEMPVSCRLLVKDAKSCRTLCGDIKNLPSSDLLVAAQISFVRKKLSNAFVCTESPISPTRPESRLASRALGCAQAPGVGAGCAHCFVLFFNKMDCQSIGEMKLRSGDIAQHKITGLIFKATSNHFQGKIDLSLIAFLPANVINK